jgi:nicotinamidase/pyrazinamidase
VKPTSRLYSSWDWVSVVMYMADVAEDFCVKYTSLDSRQRGFRTVVLDDCTKGVAPDSTDEARKEMAKEGVEFMPSSAVEEFFKK